MSVEQIVIISWVMLNLGIVVAWSGARHVREYGPGDALAALVEVAIFIWLVTRL